MPPGMALIVTLRGSNYRCLEQIFMVPKGFEPSKFDCIKHDLLPLVFGHAKHIGVKESVRTRLICSDMQALAFTQVEIQFTGCSHVSNLGQSLTKYHMFSVKQYAPCSEAHDLSNTET